MTEITRYSLWLLPDQGTTVKFDEIIGTMSERYHGPRFTPHVTLLGWVLGEEAALAQATTRLAQALRVVPLRPRGLASEQYYFRCLYVQLEPSAELLAAHTHASAVFKAGYAADYKPHLSLLYGQLAPAEKTRLSTELSARLPPAFAADRLQLVHITVAVADWRVVTTCVLRPAA